MLAVGRSHRIVSIDLSGPLKYYGLSYANMLQLRDSVGQKLKIGVVLSGGEAYASVVGLGGRYQVSHTGVAAGLLGNARCIACFGSSVSGSRQSTAIVTSNGVPHAPWLAVPRAILAFTLSQSPADRNCVGTSAKAG
jgi:hypothetical protein